MSIIRVPRGYRLKRDVFSLDRRVILTNFQQQIVAKKQRRRIFCSVQIEEDIDSIGEIDACKTFLLIPFAGKFVDNSFRSVNENVSEEMYHDLAGTFNLKCRAVENLQSAKFETDNDADDNYTQLLPFTYSILNRQFKKTINIIDVKDACNTHGCEVGDEDSTMLETIIESVKLTNKRMQVLVCHVGDVKSFAFSFDYDMNAEKSGRYIIALPTFREYNPRNKVSTYCSLGIAYNMCLTEEQLMYLIKFINSLHDRNLCMKNTNADAITVYPGETYYIVQSDLDTLHENDTAVIDTDPRGFVVHVSNLRYKLSGIRYEHVQRLVFCDTN